LIVDGTEHRCCQPVWHLERYKMPLACAWSMTAPVTRNPTPRPTDDLEAMKALGERSGWEPDAGPLRGVVLAYGCYVGERLVGCAALQVLDGCYFLEYVAVDSAMRSRGIGASLVAKIEEEARARGLVELWAKARLPGFYEKLGYRVHPGDTHGPKSVVDCRACPQYHSNCYPAIVVKPL
jgi:GNAT superfamily N-acetyltransferase